MKVNEINAYAFSDNFTIQTISEPVNVFGCEHNEEEAKALARYLDTTQPRRVVVVKNSRADVAAAKAFRTSPFLYKFRDEAFRAMGIWKKSPTIKESLTVQLSSNPLQLAEKIEACGGRCGEPECNLDVEGNHLA